MLAKATGFRARHATLRGGAYGGRAVSSAESIGCPMRRKPEGRFSFQFPEPKKPDPNWFGFVNRCRVQCVYEIRWLHMTKVSKQGKLTNPNTDAGTPETASNVGTGYEVGRAAVTATTMSAQTTHRICRP
jgi:hypothetical protein